MAARRRRPPLLLRALRGAAAVSLMGLAALVGYQGLRSAGFRFRWEVDREAPPPRLETVSPAPERAAVDRAAPAGRSAGRGAFASIDFERGPDGAPICAPCAVADEWEGEGLRLSFRSWSADSPHPFVLDARNFLPPDASPHALGPAFTGDRGLEVGVIRLDFPGRPRRVAFTLYGPDLIDRFAVSAWSGSARLEGEAIAMTVGERYRPAGRSVFRTERIVVASPGGIDRVELDGWGPPGHVLLVDDLAIDP